MLEVLRGGEAPCGEQRFPNNVLAGGLEADVGGAAAAPNTVARFEDSGMGFDEHFLLQGSEFDHGPFFVWVAEGGENLSADAEIGVIHVGPFLAFGEAEGQAAKVIGGQGKVSAVGDST
jgi:hypothetical protein